ncbi:MAG: hypothetical protein J6U20_04235 [Fibrobacter sp.]|nr:hypothetical protein [Fibrobacter sp.]
MALSETFNLDFKFGGNVELLARLENLLNRIDQRFDSVEDSVNDAAKATDNMADKVDDLNDSFKEGVGAMSEFGEKLKDIAKYYLSFQAIRSGAEKVWSFGMESMDIFATQERAENQLKGVMKNRGTLDQFQAIKDYAADIQGRSIYGDEAMIKGAGELATYVKGTESLKSMMDLLTDYAAGMTGGGEVSPEQMESLATGLGMAYDGNYMAMRRKGFDTSKLEALDAIVENGGKWGAKEKKKYGDVLDADILKQIRSAGGVTEQMRVDALKESLQDWEGLSDAVNDLDSSPLIKFNNALGDLRENVGKRIYPVFNGLVAAIDEKMPQIEVFFDRIGDMFTSMSDSFSTHLDSLFEVGERLAETLPKLVEFGLEVLEVADDVIFKFVGFKEAVIALGAALAINKVMSFKTQIISVGVELKKTAVDFMKLRTELKFTRVEMVKSAAEMTRSGLNNALKGATAQALLFTAALWGLEKVFEAGKTAIELYQQKKKEEEFSKNEADKNVAFDRMMSARKLWKSNTTDKGNYKERYDAYVAATKDYIEWTGGNLPSYIKDEMYGMKFASDSKAANAEKTAKMASAKAKGDIYQSITNNYIDQKVNVAAEVEKIGMLLNFSVRAAIQQAMKQNQNQMAVGAI